jgi:hypothetical protein
MAKNDKPAVPRCGQRNETSGLFPLEAIQQAVAGERSRPKARASLDSLMNLGSGEMGGFAGMVESERITSTPPPPWWQKGKDSASSLIEHIASTAPSPPGAPSSRQTIDSQLADTLEPPARTVAAAQAPASQRAPESKLESYPPVQVDRDPLDQMLMAQAQQRRDRRFAWAVGGAVALLALVSVALPSAEQAEPETAKLSAVVSSVAAQHAPSAAAMAALEAKADDADADDEADDEDGAADEKKDEAESGAKADSGVGSAARRRGAARSAKADPPTKKKRKKKAKAAGGSGPFPRDAARSQMFSAASRASGCRRRGGPTGRGRASVTIAPSGRVAGVGVSGPFAGTSVGRCVASVFRGVHVPPFGGGSVTVGKSFSIR